MIEEKPRTGLSRPNKGGTMTRNGVTTRVAPGAPTVLPSISRTGLERPNMGGNATRVGRTDIYGATPSEFAVAKPAAVPTPLAPATPAPLSPATPTALPSALATPSAPIASPTTTAAPQTESNNPLSGSGNAQPQGTTDVITPVASLKPTTSLAPTRSVAPAAALGISQRGNAAPMGQDSQGTQGGKLARNFKSPKAADVYAQFSRRLFGNQA